jgi:hypothetical protein
MGFRLFRTCGRRWMSCGLRRWFGCRFWRCFGSWLSSRFGGRSGRCLCGWFRRRSGCGLRSRFVRRCWSSCLRCGSGVRGRSSGSSLGWGPARGRRRLSMSSGLSLGCWTGRFGRFATRLRCGSGMGCRSRMGRGLRRSRTGDIRLHPRSGLGSHGAVLQLGDVCRWLRHGSMSGNSTVCRSKIGLVLLCNLHMLLLYRSRLQVRLAREGLLLRCRLRRYAVWPTVEAGVSVVDDGGVIDDRLIDVDVPDHGGVHAYGSCVVRKGASAPLAAGKAATAVAESIVHSSVVADLCSPIAVVEDVSSVVPTPITWGPEIAGLGRFNPGAGNPIVVAFAIPCPISGRPHVVGLWAGRLNVDREGGRSDVDADADGKLCDGHGGHREEHPCQKNFTERANLESLHLIPPNLCNPA